MISSFFDGADAVGWRQIDHNSFFFFSLASNNFFCQFPSVQGVGH